ncbi:MAG TPA: isochorismatase family protein [Actinomycetota bacterium]
MPDYDPVTALIVVDVQNDFADPDGNLSVTGGHEIIPEANRQIDLARGAGATVVYTQDWHPEHTPHFEQDGGIWPVHCVQDTWGAAFHPSLDVARGQTVRKGADGRDGYSAFSVRDPQSGDVDDTVLHEMLQSAGIRRLVIAGLATDYCVVETVLDARLRGYPVEVLAAAIAAVDLQRGDGDRAITRMRDAGAELV